MDYKFLSIVFLLFVFTNCSDKKGIKDKPIVSYNCQATTGEVFTVVGTMPVYGTNDSDLQDYISANIEISRIEEIEDGEIRLRILVSITGQGCLANVFGENVPVESIENHQSLIDNMDTWTPGQQRENKVDVYRTIVIKIIEGAIDSID